MKDAVVVAEVQKPEFKAAEIIAVSDLHYSPEQMIIAKFIAEYYFSSFSEAISLFLPFWQKSVQRSAFSVPNVPKLSKTQQQAYEQLLQK